MRVYQQVLGAFLFVFLMVESIGLAQPQGGAATVYVRKNASTPAAKADLVALQTAIAKMKTCLVSRICGSVLAQVSRQADDIVR
jgi:hypothetical protein